MKKLYLLILTAMLILNMGCSDGGFSAPTRRLLIIGDSISIGYTPFLKDGLKYNFKVERIVNESGNIENAMYSGNGIDNIDRWLSQTNDDMWDMVTFNHGLWDISGYSTVEEYKDNLRLIALKIKAKSRKAVFITSTTVIDEETDSRRNADILVYNEAAREVMKDLEIDIIDLYPVSYENREYIEDDVHFSEHGYAILARHISNIVMWF